MKALLAAVAIAQFVDLRSAWPCARARVRRLRAEQLLLVGADGTPIVLAAETREPGEIATQDVFQVSADGAYLAYAFDDTLHVRAADGVEHTIAGYVRGSEMRFSPDGSRLAAVMGDAHVMVMDLATGDVRDVATLPLGVRQLEWAGDRLVVLSRSSIIALSLDGPPATLLVGDSIDRFVAGGHRVVVFDRNDTAVHVLALDITAPDSLRELRTLEDSVTNAALTVDGKHLAFTTRLAVFTATGDARPIAISDRGDVHSLWFARDGALGYASSTSATIIGGAHAQRFDSDGPIEMLRFDATTHAPLIATDTHAWVDGKRVTGVPDGQVLGVDRFAGGTVVWTAERL